MFIILFHNFCCTGAQRLSLTSSVPFDVSTPPSLCPGSTVQFTCIATDFTMGIDWEKNNVQFQQYTGTSTNIGQNQPVPNEPGLSVTLNSLSVIVAPEFSVNFTSTVTAVVNVGISTGDNITCGNRFQATKSLIANFSAMRKSQ